MIMQNRSLVTSARTGSASVQFWCNRAGRESCPCPLKCSARSLQTARLKPNISAAGLLLDGIAWQMLALSSGGPQDIGHVYS